MRKKTNFFCENAMPWVHRHRNGSSNAWTLSIYHHRIIVCQHYQYVVARAAQPVVEAVQKAGRWQKQCKGIASHKG
jgi:hypothetical protein